MEKVKNIIMTKKQFLEEMRKLQILCEQLNIERLEEYLKISKKINEDI